MEEKEDKLQKIYKIIMLVALTAFLTFLATTIGIYEYLVNFAGAGATVPLTGFGYNLSNGVRKAINEDGFIGIFTGGLKSCAGGITAAIISGLVCGFLFKAKDKS